MALSPRQLLRRTPWQWIVSLLATAPMAWADGGSRLLGDTAFFCRAGRTLLSADWAHTYASAGVQAGPLQLALYGAAGRLGAATGVGPGRLLSPVVELGTVALLLFVLRSVLPQGRMRRLSQGVLGTLAVLTATPSLVFSAGHPADAVIPLLWVLAAHEARQGRAVRAGLILGLSANLEIWGVLGAPVLLFLPDLRRLVRAGGAQLALTLGPLAPFAAAGGLRMFSYSWPVSSGTLASLLLPVGTPFPWTLRFAQGAVALAAGAGVALLTRRGPYGPSLVPLAIVAARLLLDPQRNSYYLAAWIVLALTAAGFAACHLLPLLGRAATAEPPPARAARVALAWALSEPCFLAAQPAPVDPGRGRGPPPPSCARSLRIVEPEQPERSRPRVCADDRAERGHHLDRAARTHLPDDLLERRDTVGRGRVSESEPKRRGVRAPGLEQGAELSERLAAAADALERHDLAVLESEDRLDVQERAGERGAPADTAASGEVLERLDGEQQPVGAAVSLDESVDLLVARSALEPALHRQPEHRNRRRDRPGVDDAHRVPERRRRRRRLSARERPRQLLGQTWRERTRS